ncbi:MAG: type I glyceraldehyde-3-phosphate dehydrogenase [Chitinophagales bacterium]
MTVRVGINGFGRIGRLVFRAGLDRKDIEFVAVNDLTDAATNAHLFKYDSVHGRYDGEVRGEGDQLFVNGKAVRVFAEKDPAAIRWGEVGADIVIESTGRFTNGEDAAKHLTGGAKKVIISAPAKNEDLTVVMGVNEDKYDPAKHKILSNASCTTNCLAPVAKVIHEKFGIRRGFMTTTHSYTNDQKILDQVHKDLRRSRAAAMSMIPTTTGAAKAIGLVLPELKGKLDGFSMRVPTPDVSALDLVAELDQAVTVESLNAVLKEAAEGKLKGILGYTDEPLVSMDFRGDARSSIVDGLSTMVIGGNFVKVIAWYDNEWGYSNRVVDLASYIGGKGL